MRSSPMAEHRYDLDTDRCTCGGPVVYYEDGDAEGFYGPGCEVEGRVWPRYRVQPWHPASGGRR
jgi:hypothetical protein